MDLFPLEKQSWIAAENKKITYNHKFILVENNNDCLTDHDYY